jgi:hypothetical protein
VPVASTQPEETVLREQIAAERTELAERVRTLRQQVEETVDLRSKLSGKLPLAITAAAGAGFLFGGGLGATARLLVRRRREGREKAKLGRFSVVDH